MTQRGTWTVTKARMRKHGNTGRKRVRFVLRLRDPWGMELLAHNFSARKIREFADAATDALNGSRGAVNGWEIEHSPNGLKLTGRCIFIDSRRGVLTDLIAQIDQVLED